MKTIRQLLADKGNAIWSVAPDDTVFDALKMMSEKRVGALLVRDSGHLVGIFSERDYARKIILQGRSSKQTRVRAIMSENVVTAVPEQTVEECMALMTEKHIRHLPVLEDGSLAGVVSIGDLVKAIITDQKFIIDQLESYITS